MAIQDEVARYLSLLPSLVLSFLFFLVLTPPQKLDAGSDKIVHDFGFVFGVRGLHPLLPIINFFGSIFNFFAFAEARTYAKAPSGLFQAVTYFTCLFGCLLRLWAYVTLGRYFTYQVGIRDNHELVTSGPYSALIHPSYTGLWLACLGGVSYFLSPWLGHLRLYTIWLARLKIIRQDPRPWVARIETFIETYGPALVALNLAIAALGTWRRISIEEAVLREHFGPAKWDDYVATRSRLVPGIF